MLSAAAEAFFSSGLNPTFEYKYLVVKSLSASNNFLKSLSD
jgi:hypothetical protein